MPLYRPHGRCSLATSIAQAEPLEKIDNAFALIQHLTEPLTVDFLSILQSKWMSPNHINL